MVAFFNRLLSARIGGREHGPGKESSRRRRRSRRCRNTGSRFQTRRRIQCHHRLGRRGRSASGARRIACPGRSRFAKAEEIDRIVGLELGADDYVSKPFSPREVVLRAQAILRRGETPGETESFVAGPIRIDGLRHHVSVNGKVVHLTSLEYKLLRTLVQRRGRVQERDRLLSDVWGYESVIDTRTVDTHVRRLREKLGKAGDAIETIRGFGYRLRES